MCISFMFTKFANLALSENVDTEIKLYAVFHFPFEQRDMVKWLTGK